MFEINKFFEKFRKIYSDRKLKEETIIFTIKECCGVLLKEGDLDIKEFDVFIKTKPIIRNYIFINRQKIEKSFKDKGLNINLK